jgi:hypothetical protein
MKVRLDSNCREFDNVGGTCCLIEYVSVAPWNRPAGTAAKWIATGQVARDECGTERVTPCGRALFAAAMHLSEHLGHEGRLGWFAEAGAVSSYREWFPEILGGRPDPGSGGFPWFEITPQMAEHFLNEFRDRLIP